MRSAFSGWQRPVLVVLVLFVVIGLMVVNYRLAKAIPGGNDFLARWNGAHAWLVEGMNPYDEQVSLAAQIQLYGRPADPLSGESLAHFNYPLYSMIFFAPFGLLPFPFARALWITLLEFGLVMLVLMGTRLARWKLSTLMLFFSLVFVFLSFPSIRSLLVGEFAILQAVLMIGALLAVHRRQDALAGIIFALSTVRPQMSVLVLIFVFLWSASRRRWRIILWTVGSLVALIGASLLLISDWWLLWLRQFVDIVNNIPQTSPVQILANIVPGAKGLIIVGLTTLVGLYLLGEWILALNKDDPWFQWTALITIVVTNLIIPRSTTMEYVIMLPAWFFIFSAWNRRLRRSGSIGIILTIVSLTAIQWLLFLFIVQNNEGSMIMHLPLPLLSFLGLWWIRWWTIQPQKMRIDGLV